MGERLARHAEEMQSDLVVANERAQEEITRRKRVDRALSESDRHYRALYDEAPHAYFSFNPQGLVLMSNRSAGELLGYHQDDLIGRSIFDLYPEGPTGRGRAKLLLLQFESGEEIENEEIEMRRSDGERVWVSWTLHAVKSTEGEIVQSWSIAIDITERKEADEALRDSEHRLANILDISADAIISMNESQQIFVFNRGAQKIFGYAASDVVGQPWTCCFRRCLRICTVPGPPLPNMRFL